MTNRGACFWKPVRGQREIELVDGASNGQLESLRNLTDHRTRRRVEYTSSRRRQTPGADVARTRTNSCCVGLSDCLAIYVNNVWFGRGCLASL